MEDKYLNITKHSYKNISILCFVGLLALCVSSPVLANTFEFNPKTLKWRAIAADGRVIKSGPGSAGANYCRDVHRGCRTPVGIYHVWNKGGADCKSSKYPLYHGGAPMPHCMFFSKKYAIHGSFDVPHRNASHGCIRVRPSDAKWLSSNFVHIGTKVIVKSY